MLRKLPGWLALPALALSVAGCLFSPQRDKPTPPPQQDRTSIGGVLNALIAAYQNRDLDLYEKLFDQDHYKFVFSPADVGGQDPLPPNWGWPEERESTKNMFEEPLVEKIELSFSFATPRLVEEADDPPVDATHMTYLTELNLIVTTRNPDTGEQDIYVVQGDRHDFFLRQDPNETQDGQPVWKIVEWRDRSLGHGLLATGGDPGQQ